MNADLVQRMARATLAGDLPFPEIVGNLLAEGVEYYRIDYVGFQLPSHRTPNPSFKRRSR